MSTYQSNYAKRYLQREKAGIVYEKAIDNVFENVLWSLEQDVLYDIFSKFSDTTPKMYLDYATGTGRIVHYIAENFTFSTITAADISPGMLLQAQNNAPRNSTITFIQANIAEDLDLLNGPYDIVTAFRLFLNLEEENRGKIFGALSSIVKKDGWLIFNNHMNRYSIKGMIAYFLHKYLKFPLKSQVPAGGKSIINTWTKSEIIELVSQFDFEVEKIYTLGVLPGHKRFIPLPWKLYRRLEKRIMNIPFLSIFAKDQIYVCRKTH